MCEVSLARITSSSWCLASVSYNPCPRAMGSLCIPSLNVTRFTCHVMLSSLNWGNPDYNQRGIGLSTYIYDAKPKINGFLHISKNDNSDGNVHKCILFTFYLQTPTMKSYWNLSSLFIATIDNTHTPNHTIIWRKPQRTFQTLVCVIYISSKLVS